MTYHDLALEMAPKIFVLMVSGKTNELRRKKERKKEVKLISKGEWQSVEVNTYAFGFRGNQSNPTISIFL